MNSCDAYYYYNFTQNICELCHPKQIEYGTLSWSILAILFIMMCCFCNEKLGFPSLIVFIIAINQFECDRKWDTSMTNTLLMLDIIILLIGVVITYQEIKYKNRIILSL